MNTSEFSRKLNSLIKNGKIEIGQKYRTSQIIGMFEMHPQDFHYHKKGLIDSGVLDCSKHGHIIVTRKVVLGKKGAQKEAEVPNKAEKVSSDTDLTKEEKDTVNKIVEEVNDKGVENVNIPEPIIPKYERRNHFVGELYKAVGEKSTIDALKMCKEIHTAEKIHPEGEVIPLNKKRYAVAINFYRSKFLGNDQWQNDNRVMLSFIDAVSEDEALGKAYKCIMKDLEKEDSTHGYRMESYVVGNDEVGNKE
jgi:hypothetical protein